MSRKRFQITANDLTFIHGQVAMPRLMIIGYDTSGKAIYGLKYTDSNGVKHLDPISTGHAASGPIVHWIDINGVAHDTAQSQVSYQGAFDPLQLLNPVTGLPLYSSARVADGLRNVSGFYNNLTDLGAAYGTFASKFIHVTKPDYSHYVQENSGNSALTNAHSPASDGATDNSAGYSNPTHNVVDYTPRMISQTIVSGGVTFLKAGANLLHDSNGTAVVDSYERDADGNLVLRDSHGNIVHDPALGSPSIVNGGQIQSLGGEIDSGAGTYTDHYVDGNGDTQTIEVQNPVLFLRNVNDVVGDPSVSGIQVLFGQFFDHGLDFIDKPGAHAKIVVPLSPDDPLYGSIGPDGQPVYSMTISRSIAMNASDAGADGKFGTFDDVGYSAGADGIQGTADDVYATAQYQNFDSPYIDQNQTYGSTDQVTTLLRGWVLNPNYIGDGNTYVGPANATDPSHKWIPGAALLDGHTLKAGWNVDPNHVENSVLDPTKTPPGGSIFGHYTDAAGHYVDASGAPSASPVPFNSGDTLGAGVKVVGHYLDGSGHYMKWEDSRWHVENVVDAQGNITQNVLTDQTLPTLNELRAALAATGRDDLTWEDIANYRARDSYGHVLDNDAATPGVQALQTGEAIILDMNPTFDAAHIQVGNPQIAAAIAALNATFTDGSTLGVVGGQLTLHLASPVSAGPMTIPPGDYSGLAAMMLWINPADNSIVVPAGAVHDAVGQLMLASIGDHYVAGDGRANENFGLTALHHVFHEDHNVQLMNMQANILEQQAADPTHAYAHQWQVGVSDGHGGFLHDANGNYTDAAGNISWDNETLFQSTKLIVEMEYQHVAIDQYARLVTPDLPEFVTYDSGLNSDISLEYGEAAFRFGHSQLRETIDALEVNASGSYDLTGAITHYALGQAFLNPGAFANVGPSAILMGMDRQVANETDEFVTPALQQGLLGQPLDLATINIARGRDLGIPTLNEARSQLYNSILAERAGDANGTSHSLINVDALKPYTSWADFGAHMIHPDDLMSFIAAYSFDGDKAHAQAVIDADAGDPTALMGYNDANGQPFVDGDAALDYAINFMNGGDGGYNKVDLWLGGLAEAHVYGGMLGPTFNAIFEDQMERLMDGDRFYYLYRLDGALPYVTDLNQAITTEQFKDIIERTTDARSLNGDVMTFDDSNVDLSAKGSAQDHKYGDVVDDFAAAHGGYGIYSSVGNSTLANGHTVTIDGHQYMLDYRPDGGENPDGTAAVGYNSHEAITGTDYNDYIMAGNGDDTIYGGKGDDYLNGDTGANHIYGQEGNDTIIGNDLDDFLDGGDGNDTIYAGASGGITDIVIGGDGNDHLYGGAGIDNLFGDAGDDYIDAGSDTDLFYGGYGNDMMIGGDGPDELRAGYGDDILSGGSGPDLLYGEQGDDIMLIGIGGGATQGDGDEAIGDVGFDLVSFTDLTLPLDYAADLNNQNLTAAPGTTVHYEPFDAILTGNEGFIGTRFDDNAASQTTPGAKGLIGDDAANWLIGGSGNDTLQGNGGNDLIVGGSVRLDALIGKYQTGGVDDPYTSYVEGATDRVSASATLTNGFLGSIGWDKHFTDLLKSKAYKDFVLGDGGTDGTADKAVFQGNFNEYTLKAVDINGHEVANPHGNWASVFALQVTDHLATRTLADGVTVVPGDGTDYVIGVEQLAFKDQTVNPQAYFDIAPTLDLASLLVNQNATIASDGFGILTPYNGGSGWAGNWTEIGDNNSSSSGQIKVDLNGKGLFSFDSTLDFAGGSGASFDGASISRGVNLAGASNVQLSFDVKEAGLGAGETVKVYYSASGNPPTAGDTPIYTIDQNTNSNSDTAFHNHVLNLSGASATGKIYFVASAMASGHNVYVDNVSVTKFTQVEQYPGNNYTISYTEQAAGVAIALNPKIADVDDPTVKSVTVKLRDGIAGDKLNVGALSGGITATGNGTGLITLTGVATSTFSDFQATLAAITFSNPTNDNPTSADRHIDVTANDGFKDSAVATTTVHFTPVDDPSVGTPDTIITNFGTTQFTIADWMLTRNDTDPDSTPTIGGIATGALAPSGLTVTHNSTAHTVTITDTGTPGGTFNYTLPAATAVTVQQQTGSTLTGTSANEIIIGNAGNNTLNGNDGNDILQGAGGNDTLDGGNGNDILIGGMGHDLLTGGVGADAFVFNSTAEAGNVIGTGNGNADVINDFISYIANGATHDTIDLSAIDANGSSSGTPAFIWDGQVASGNHVRGHVGYHTQVIGGVTHTIIDGNTGTGTTHDFQIDLVGSIQFTPGQDVIL